MLSMTVSWTIGSRLVNDSDSSSAAHEYSQFWTCCASTSSDPYSGPHVGRPGSYDALPRIEVPLLANRVEGERQVEGVIELRALGPPRRQGPKVLAGPVRLPADDHGGACVGETPGADVSRQHQVVMQVPGRTVDGCGVRAFMAAVI